MKKLIAVFVIIMSFVASSKANESSPSLGLGIGFTIYPETFLIRGNLIIL